MHGTKDEDAGEAGTFEQRAAEKPPGLLRDLFDFVRQNRKWWLVPILVVLLLLGLLLILAPTVLGPFLYPLF